MTTNNLISGMLRTFDFIYYIISFIYYIPVINRCQDFKYVLNCHKFEADLSLLLTRARTNHKLISLQKHLLCIYCSQNSFEMC